jgi:tetratricopeptide (TPR) repeat protein
MILSGQAQERKRWICWALPILVALCAGMPYLNSLKGPFIYDDIDALRDNPQIRTLAPWGPSATATTLTGRPVLRLSFAVDYAIGGLRVEAYHITNLLIHVGVALLLYGIVRRNLPDREFWGDRFADAGPYLAAGVAAVWGTHPLNTEAITLIVQRAESLAGLFYLAVIYCTIRAADPSSMRRRWRIGAVVCCAMGMATKETMATAPLMALLYDRTFLAGSFARALRARWGLYVGLAATWLVLAVAVFTAGSRGGTAGLHAGVAMHDYARTQLGVVAHYLFLVVWPGQLVLDYAWPIAHSWGQVGWGGVLVGTLLAGSIVALWVRPWLGFLGAWFFGILLPSSSFVPIVTEVAAEHRMYLPLMAPIALAIVGGWALCRWIGLGWLIWAAAAAAVAIGSRLTIQRNADYRTALQIWQITVAQRPRNGRAHFNLGHSWKEIAEGLTPGTPPQLDAAGHALAEFQTALKLEPNRIATAQELAETLMDLGDYRDSERAFDVLLSIDPSFIRGHLVRGKLRVLRQDWPDAANDFQAVADAVPDQPEAHFYLGVCLQQMGQWKRAQDQFERVLALSPGGYRDSQKRLVEMRIQQER